MTLSEALTEAGLTVVEGHVWEDRGEPMISAGTIRVLRSNTEHPVSVAELVDALSATSVSALVTRKGEVWLLAQTSVDDQIRVVLDVPQGSEPTIVQRDAALVLVSLLEAVAFEAETVDEVGLPEPAEEKPRRARAKKD